MLDDKESINPFRDIVQRFADGGGDLLADILHAVDKAGDAIAGIGKTAGNVLGYFAGGGDGAYTNGGTDVASTAFGSDAGAGASISPTSTSVSAGASPTGAAQNLQVDLSEFGQLRPDSTPLAAQAMAQAAIDEQNASITLPPRSASA